MPSYLFEKNLEVPQSSVERDLQEIISYEGVVSRYGIAGQLEVLNPKVQVFFEKYEDIKKLGAYSRLIGRLSHEGNEGPEPTLRKYITKVFGMRSLTQPLDTLKIEDDIPDYGIEVDDVSIAMMNFANNLYNLMDRKPWIIYNNGDLQIYKSIAARANEIQKQRDSIRYIDGELWQLNPVYKANIRIETFDDAEIFAKELSPDLALYTRDNLGDLTRDLTGDGSMFRRVGSAQLNTTVQAVRVYETQYEQVKPENMPEIIILGGVGHTEKTWGDRVEYYIEMGYKCRYIEYPERFDENASFKKQAETIAEILKNEEGKKYSFEVHSRGGLTAWHIMHDHPELVDHVIMTSAPTRSNEDSYIGCSVIIKGMEFCLSHPDLAEKIFNSNDAFSFFAKIPDWQEAFYIYMAHMGKFGKSQWDSCIQETSPTIPKVLIYGSGKNDPMVAMAGFGAIEYSTGAVIIRHVGGHEVVGDHNVALRMHQNLHHEALKRQESVINQ